ncbi:LysR family transcriptional regulator [Reyranella sp.]|uniref:LysR family transcriptional regulator n=1 Tax=Reyranella sp. TaxID=1929291 RepID=UPI002730819A|nr:LysR family transcriptional regulator [Reyranella sp.]MDP2374385.1 LysR family transcriptional regulator [Reyranella sp.]
MPFRIDPYSLHLLVAALREGSIARAAVRENIAPSALSRRLSDLERTLGVMLLRRGARGVEATEAGLVAVSLGEHIEDEFEALAHQVKARDRTITGSVRLFATSSSVVGFLPEKLRDFIARYPAVRINLQECRSPDVLQACADGIADVGLCVGAMRRNSLESWVVARDSLVVLVPAGHALMHLRTVRFAQVLDHPLIGVQSGGALDHLMRERALKAGRRLQLTVTVGSVDAVCRMVETGLGIAVVPTSTASAYTANRSFLARPLDEPWSARELRLCAPRKPQRPRAATALIEHLRRKG